MVARQHELQSGAVEATAIALAAKQGAHTDTVKLKEMLVSSLDLSEDQVTVDKVYRCDASEEYVSSAEACENYYGNSDDNEGGGNDAKASTYVRLNLSDTYSPIWTQWGIHHDLTYTVQRTVQLS